MDFNNLKKEFDTKGFVIFRNFFDKDKLENLTRISEGILDKAKKGKWPHIRIYRDYPNFFNKLNIFGIDYPFNFELHEDTFKEFQKLEYKKTLINFLGWENFQTPLIRLHSNSSFYNYQGEWHRDDPKFPSENSIQIIFYLYDEVGYRIVPKNKNHLLENYGILINQTRTEGRGFAKLPTDMYEIISAKKGDVLVHQSGLLHQGFCKKKRLHYHIRHIRDENIKQNNNNLLNIDEKYFGEFNILKLKSNTYNIYDKSLRMRLKRLRTFLLYFIPRIKSMLNNYKNKNKDSIFHSTIWQ